jgi:hypothetical protein
MKDTKMKATNLKDTKLEPGDGEAKPSGKSSSILQRLFTKK